MRRLPVRPDLASTARGSAFISALLLPVWLATSAGAQIPVRISGWPVGPVGPDVIVSDTPDGVRFSVDISDPLTGLAVDVQAADASRLGPGHEGGTRTSIGPVRWMAPESIRARRYSGLVLTGSGASPTSGTWSTRLSFEGTGELPDGTPATYLASFSTAGVPVDGGLISLRLADGNGNPLYEGNAQEGSSVLYESSAPPTSTVWSCAAAAVTTTAAKVSFDGTPILSTLRVRLGFEAGTRLQLFDPFDPDTPIVFTIDDPSTVLEMDQELDPVIGGTLSVVNVNVFDDEGGPLALVMRSVANAVGGQEIVLLDGTEADAWIDADGASGLSLTPSDLAVVSWQTELEACTVGIAVQPRAPVGLRTDGTLSRFALEEFDALGAVLRTVEGSASFDAVSGGLHVGVDASDPSAVALIRLLEEEGIWYSADVDLGGFSAWIERGPIPAGNACPTILVGGPDADGTTTIAMRFAEPAFVQIGEEGFSQVSALEWQITQPDLAGSHTRRASFGLALDGDAPAELLASKEWVKPCPTHALCSARALGRASVTTFGERGVLVSDIGRGALTGGSGEAYPGGVLLECVDGRHASVEFSTSADPLLPGVAWQIDTRFAAFLGAVARSFARPGPAGTELGFDLSPLTASPSVQVDHFDANGGLLGSVDAAHGEVAMVVSDPVVAFHVDSPGHSDYIKLSWDLGQDLAGGGAVARKTTVVTGRVEARVPLSIPVDLSSLEVNVDGPPSVLLFVGDEPIGVAAPPAVPSRASSLRLAAITPNPFNPRAIIEYELDQPGTVNLTVFDARGRSVRELFVGELLAGAHSVVWNGEDDRGRAVTSGVYFVRAVRAEGGFDQRKIALVR